MTYSKISGFSDEIDRDIITQFEALKKLNISYFEPRGVDGKNISALTAGEAVELKKKCEAYGIKASSIGSPIGKIKLSDDFTAHFETFKKVVETAHILDCENIRMFSFYHDGGEWSVSEREEVISKLGKMVEYAKQNGVVLLHENEKDIYGDTAERCLDLMNIFYGDNFKAVFDPANFVQCGQDTKKAFDLMKPYIEYMHIKDAKLSDGRVVPAGYGDGNLEYILTGLFKDGYNGFLSLEPHLGKFEGLDKLEVGELMNGLPESGEGTFTVAYKALFEILERIGL